MIQSPANETVPVQIPGTGNNGKVEVSSKGVRNGILKTSLVKSFFSVKY
jgi:hypothetical protein